MIARYARLLGIQLRTSALLAVQYRVDFAVQALLAFFWSAVALAPLLVLFELRDGLAGWTPAEALTVVAFFTLLKGFLAGAVQPSLLGIVEHIRKGTLDFLLLKPADAQFLVSTARFDLARFADVLAGLAILGVALSRRPTPPSTGDALLAALLTAGAASLIYSLWMLVTSLAFYVVKVDNLSYLFVSIYDAARWPASVFRGVFAVFFTFVIPLALMTTYPALAILGRITSAQVALALGAALAFFALSRLVWVRAVRRYTSAGG